MLTTTVDPYCVPDLGLSSQASAKNSLNSSTPFVSTDDQVLYPQLRRNAYIEMLTFGHLCHPFVLLKADVTFCIVSEPYY